MKSLLRCGKALRCVFLPYPKSDIEWWYKRLRPFRFTSCCVTQTNDAGSQYRDGTGEQGHITSILTRSNNQSSIMNARFYTFDNFITDAWKDRQTEGRTDQRTDGKSLLWSCVSVTKSRFIISRQNSEIDEKLRYLHLTDFGSCLFRSWLKIIVTKLVCFD